MGFIQDLLLPTLQLMTAQEYRAAIAELGLTVAAAGRILASGTRTTTERMSRRWASGESSVPKSVELALILLRQSKVPPQQFDPFDVRPRR